jgi:hypothetical protein
MGLHQPVANWLPLLVFSGIDRDEGLTPIDPRHTFSLLAVSIYVDTFSLVTFSHG